MLVLQTLIFNHDGGYRCAHTLHVHLLPCVLLGDAYCALWSALLELSVSQRTPHFGSFRESEHGAVLPVCLHKHMRQQLSRDLLDG
mmetsp:Transcript_14860/g.45408  ORF Transcript_14860/g.45408 Transcript_14860/m.45408 type:complete len:86 (+) Transcript_14860:556-813(+)